jgi:SAM-dependent methyltransferase
MAAMKRIRMPMHRYGEVDFDKGYLQWGFHDAETQANEADSVVRIAGEDKRLRILDLACGTGVHAVHWAKQGHTVTGVDLSETFIAQARERMLRESVSVDFIVSDIRDLACHETYDVVTWIENSFFDDDIINGGCFVLDVRNPENAQAKFRQGNWRTWREENGVFYLERHEIDAKTGIHEDAWITINPQLELIEERVNTTERPMALDQKMHVMKKAGFHPVELRTMDGRIFSGGPDPYWLWLVGRR